jgi:undecaprenyl-diphosphatase
LLPISSSGHTTVIPWLLRSGYSDADPELRKTLEVVLHAGATAALLITWRGQLTEEVTTLGRRELAFVAVASMPAAIAGHRLERLIERGLGDPPGIAAGLLVGALAMFLCDRAPERRGAKDAGLTDALWLGLAQACALAPGVSRTGATLTAARLRGFTRADASLLSRRLAFPVITGASALKAWRLARSRLERPAAAPLMAGLAASFVSTLLAVRVLPMDGEGPLWPYAVYRTFLAAVILARLPRSPQGSANWSEPPTTKDMPD